MVRRPERDISFDADAGQMRQMLLNLVKNGLEALNGDGSVVVSAEEKENALEIAVADSGSGLTPEQRAHLFVPGFTTKTHGSGLGFFRYVVERTLAGFSRFRRIAVCYERKGEHFQGLHELAACCITVSRLRHYELQF